MSDTMAAPSSSPPSSPGNTPLGRVIIDPYPTTSLEFRYKNLQQCIDDISSAMTSFTDGSRADGSWMIFSGVDERAFEDISNSENAILSICSKFFNPTGNLLIFKMESLWHSTTTMAVTRWIDRTAHAMNVESEMLITGTGIHKLSVLDEDGRPSVSEGSVSTIQKKADQTIYPFTCPTSRPMKWPSFVLEVTYTEQRARVQEDMRLWLRATEGQVEFAMTASVQPTSKRITLEQWELKPQPTRDHPKRLIAHPVQKMWIQKPRQTGQKPIVGGRFEIPFRSIFLREPQGSEADFLMTNEEIERIARDVWRVDTIIDANR
ncbi:uncharacterized protein PGRI_004660 [Penicillium griseofulvum]|uniref:Uncharacterized protein n=1 Tax=Penicillium patulum TaxID=5078 RepID=A0A135LWT2_PENPA|nr:uncharacterized protein PGRI_004660 [Penicillium griseofulvum]KXG53416.1 hypothetical protein PGRI_004660 [Penicillium griseofulvum]